MRRTLFAFTIVAALATASPLLAQSAAKPAPRVRTTETPKLGTYDLELTTDAGTMVGELTLTKSGETIAAAVTAGGNRPQVRSFVRQDDKYVLTGGHGTLIVIYDLTFQRDSVTGTFRLSQGGAGKVAGVLRK